MTAVMWLRNLAAFAHAGGRPGRSPVRLLARASEVRQPRAARWRTGGRCCWRACCCRSVSHGRPSRLRRSTASVALRAPVADAPSDAQRSGADAASRQRGRRPNSHSACCRRRHCCPSAVACNWRAGCFGGIRREASRLDPLPDAIRLAQERVGARADMFVSRPVAGPITFGCFVPSSSFRRRSRRWTSRSSTRSPATSCSTCGGATGCFR